MTLLVIKTLYKLVEHYLISGISEINVIKYVNKRSTIVIGLIKIPLTHGQIVEKINLSAGSVFSLTLSPKVTRKKEATVTCLINILYTFQKMVEWYKAFRQQNPLTRVVLVFATEGKNNVNPCRRSQKKVNNVQLFFAK